MNRLTAFALLLAACGSSAPDPLVPLLPDPDALTDVALDLNAVLEAGRLAGACDRWRAGATDRRSRLLCGKQLFFYESFGTAGVPAALPQFLIDHFPDEIGPGFEKQGMIADPTSPTHLPLGLAPTTRLGGQVDALAFTCASCHFAKLPDGRYAVGAPNHAYQYGKQILSLTVFPTVALLGSAAQHDPLAIKAIQPLLDRVATDPTLKPALLGALLPLATGGVMMPTLSTVNEHHYASWPAGTMDFLIQPLPVDDTVHTVSKISALFSIPAPDELQRAKLSSDWLGFTGAASSVLMFAHGFVTLGGNRADWTDDQLAPLVDYVHSLRPPANPAPPDATRGRALFASSGCASCHAGPRGMGQRLYDYAEVGTDDAMKRWLDPTLTNTACCNLPPGAPVVITHQLKSPRIAGEWTMSRFLHDGALTSLEQLLCLEDRPASIGDAMGTQGHTFGCDLAASDRAALVAWLRAN